MSQHQQDKFSARRSTRSNIEQHDNYRRVVLSFSQRWRLIIRNGGSKWVLQHRASPDQWQSRDSFSQAKHVPDAIRELVGERAYQLARMWTVRSARTRF